MKIKHFMVLGSLLVFATTRAIAVTSPTEVNVKIYELWVSPNADCTSMTKVFEDTSPSYQDMTEGPTFGSMTVPNGTYQCIAWKMSDLLQFTPQSVDGSCLVQQYTRDLFRANIPAETSTCPDSTVLTGTGSLASPVEDRMCIYMSVNGDNSNVGNIPSSPMQLTSPYVVSGNQTGTMVTNFTNKIDGSQPDCDCLPPVFGFR